MRVVRRALPLLCLLLVPASLQAQGRTAPPSVVVRFSSIDSLIDHVRFLASLAGQKDAARQIEGLIKQKTGDKGLEGVDARRPFGFYGRVGKDLDDISGALLIPIADERAFLNLLQNLSVQTVKGEGGIYSIKTNTPVDAYLRFANKYAYVTALNPKALDDKNLLDPAMVLAGKPTSALLLTIQLDQVPEAAKAITTAQAEQVLQELQDLKVPGETPAQKSFRVAALKEVIRLIALVLKDGKELKAEVDLDQRSGDLAATFSLSGLSGSEMAAGIEAVATNSSLFAGLLKKGAAVSGMGHVKLPEALASALGDAAQDAKAMAVNSIQDVGKKQQAESLFKVLIPTLRAGDFDGALVMTSQGKQLTVLGATKVKNGDELGKTVRELVAGSMKDLPPALRDKIKLDVGTVGATKIHKLELPVEDQGSKMVQKVFGEASLYVAFRNDAMFFSLGKDGLQSIKDAIPVKATGSTPMFLYEVDIAQLATLAPPDQADKARKIFPGGQGGIVRLTVQGGRALTVRLDTKVSVLQYLGQMHDMKGPN
jgi:hypothetical protein